MRQYNKQLRKCPDLWGDTLYRSKKDNNVYPPSVRPEDWEEAE